MKQREQRLAGVMPVFQTPFRDDESIDYPVLEREIDWLFECGCDGIVMAMVSETLRLSSEERDGLATAACELARGRGAVVISVGAESSHTAVRHARRATEIGAAAVMAIPPLSVGCGESQLQAYYRRIIDAIPLPVIVQDASGYVGKPLSLEMQARLLDEYGPDRVLFKPEAAPIGQRLSGLRDATGGRARVFEGSGGMATVDSHRRGIVGTMPGADLAQASVALWKALEAGDESQVRQIGPRLADLVALQTGLDGFLAIEKYLLVRQGIFRNQIVRGPVGFELDPETAREVDRRFDHLMAAVKEHA